jgi:hypothetical protein
MTESEVFNDANAGFYTIYKTAMANINAMPGNAVQSLGFDLNAQFFAKEYPFIVRTFRVNDIGGFARALQLPEVIADQNYWENPFMQSIQIGSINAQGKWKTIARKRVMLRNFPDNNESDHFPIFESEIRLNAQKMFQPQVLKSVIANATLDRSGEINYLINSGFSRVISINVDKVTKSILGLLNQKFN